MNIGKQIKLATLTKWYRNAASLYEKELLLKLILFYQPN